MAIISILLTAIIIIVSILLVLIVLVQRPKQEGLGAAFGGGAFDSALGAHTTDVLQKITTYMAVIFFVSAIGLAMVKARQFKASPANNVLENVDNRDATSPALPGMPSGISSLPGLETEGVTTPAPLIDDSAAKKEISETAPAKTGESAPKPDADAPKPDADAPKPDADAPKPDAAAPKPDAAAPKPDAAAPKPDAAAPKPDAAAPKPEASTPAPKTPAETPAPAAKGGKGGK